MSSTITVLDSTGATQAIAKVTDVGRAAAANSLPIVWSTEDLAALNLLFTQATGANMNTTLLAISANTPAPITGALGSASPITARAFSTQVTFNRTADTNAYLANDVMGSATAANGAVQTFAVGSAAGSILITGVDLRIDAASVPAGMTSFRLYLYSVSPPSALGDNAAWDLPAGDRAGFLGYLDMGVPSDLGSTLYCQSDLSKQVALASGNLYAFLVTNGAFTPAASTPVTMTIRGQGV